MKVTTAIKSNKMIDFNSIDTGWGGLTALEMTLSPRVSRPNETLYSGEACP